MILLDTPHGSRLYGFAHAGSDHDRYIVTSHPHKRRKQTIIGKDDVMELDYASFLKQCAKGVPQALEAMFSQQATVDLLPHFRHSYVAAGSEIRKTYKRTVRSFMEEGSFKRRRHALRLIYQYGTLERMGRFEPTLTPGWVSMMTHLANDQEKAESFIERWLDNYRHSV